MMLKQELKWTVSLAIIGMMACLFVNSAAADEATSKATLTKYKLKLFGTTWVLADDQALMKEVGGVRRLKGAYDAQVRSYKSAERSIRKLKSQISYLQFKMDKLKGEQQIPQTREYHKKLSDQVVLLTAKIRKGTEIKAKKESEAQGKVDKAQLAYLDNVKKVSPKIDALITKYEKLGKNSEVAGALTDYNTSTKRKTVLGPSTVIKSNARFIEMVAKDIESGEIKLKKEHNILWVDVMLNGKGTRSMVLDTGASTVMLPIDFAAEVGLVPTADTPTVRLQQADGTIVEGKLMTLKSVKVGQFIVEDVECVVLEEKAIAAQPLLGGSFLKHFVYRIDPNRGRIMMTRKSVSKKKKDKKKI